MREPRPDEFDHYPDRELDPKSEERRAYDNAMCRYWHRKELMPVAKNLPRERLSDVFDQSLGDDHSLVVQTSRRKNVVFCNTVVKIKTKVTEFDGPDGFTTRWIADNKSGCRAVVFDNLSVSEHDVVECLAAMCPDLILDRACDDKSLPTDTWLLIL